MQRYESRPPEGVFFGGEITECSENPAQREEMSSPSRGQINWRESSLGVLASLYGFFQSVFLTSWQQQDYFLTFQFCSGLAFIFTPVCIKLYASTHVCPVSYVCLHEYNLTSFYSLLSWSGNPWPKRSQSRAGGPALCTVLLFLL